MPHAIWPADTHRPASLASDLSPDLLLRDAPWHYRQTVECQGLDANVCCMIDLTHGSEILVTASVQTLSIALPGRHEAPFTVLLASCFCQEKDVQGEVVQRVGQLPHQDRPAVKILCGDQVYLDYPTFQWFPSDCM